MYRELGTTKELRGCHEPYTTLVSSQPQARSLARYKTPVQEPRLSCTTEETLQRHLH